MTTGSTSPLPNQCPGCGALPGEQHQATCTEVTPPSRFCRDCYHFPPEGSLLHAWSVAAGAIACGRTFTEEKLEAPDPVYGSLSTGKFHWKNCVDCRSAEGDCGPEGRLFESRVEKEKEWSDKCDREWEEQSARIKAEAEAEFADRKWPSFWSKIFN